MTLRPWKTEDISSIFELEKVCFSDPWSKRMFVDGFSSPYFHGVLIEEDGRIIAYACQSVLFENAEINNVAVSPAKRKKGLATRLMDAMEEEAKKRGAEYSFLEVRSSNEPALALYKKRGYQPLFVRARYYPDGEDAIVMKKNFE